MSCSFNRNELVWGARRRNYQGCVVDTLPHGRFSTLQ